MYRAVFCVTIISAESEIKSRLLRLVAFAVIHLGKVWMNELNPSIWVAFRRVKWLSFEKKEDNSELKTVDKATGNHSTRNLKSS